METAPQFEGEKKYNRENVAKEAMEKALDTLEEKIGMPFEEATLEDRITATAELLAEIETQGENSDRHVAEALARLRRLAELELSFKTQQEKFTRVLH